MYFYNSKNRLPSQSQIADELSFTTVTGTINKSSKGASTFVMVLCICSVLSLVLTAAITLILSICALACACAGLPSAKRDRQLGVVGSVPQIVILIFLSFFSLVIFIAALFMVEAGY